MRIPALLLIVLTISVTGCRQYAVDAPPSEATIAPRAIEVTEDVPFALHVDETAFLSSGQLSIRMAAVVEDTRCPGIGLCETAGSAGVLLELLSSTAGSDRVVVLIPGLVEVPYHTNNVFLSGDHRYTLLELSPYPEVGNAVAKEDYRALLLVN